MSDWVITREKLFDAFINVRRLDLSGIPIIGCCEKHEPDFDWYRHHTWQEFENAIETRGFDHADFVAIHPIAFHYFTPGVLRTAIKRLVTDAEKYCGDESWIWHYIIAPDRLDKFKKQYLPLYDVEQRQAVSETLSWYRQWYWDQKGYDFDEEDDNLIEEDRGKISETITLIWQGDT